MGGEGEFYPDEFSNIKTKIIVNLKPKVRVIGAEEWTAVVTLHTPHPRRGGGGLVVVGRGEFDLSTYFIHITIIFHQNQHVQI